MAETKNRDSVMTRLLFTGGGGAGNEAIHRLWRKRYDLHFADADGDAIAPDIPAERRHTIPRADGNNFAEDLAALCRDLEIDVLVPGVDEELPFMPEIGRISPDTRILVPNEDYVASMLDKLETMRVLAAHRIDAPATELLGEAAAVGFPCVAKPRRGRGSRGFAILNDETDAEAYGRLHGANDSVAQELLRGQEYTVMMAADADARLRAVVPIRVDIKRGVTIRAETEDNELVTKACEAIHAALPTPGLYNVQLMLTDGGRVAPFEINPRISTTFCLCIAAKIDPVAVFLGMGGEEGVQAFTAGVRLDRYWRNEISDMEK